MRIRIWFKDSVVSDNGLISWHLNRSTRIQYPVWMLNMCNKHESMWHWIPKGKTRSDNDYNDITRYFEMTKDL